MTSGEDTSEIVKNIGTLIDVYINDTDISISHRIPLANNGESGSTPNDMPECSNILESNLFADDTNLFLNSPNILNLETNLNVELEKVSQWYMLTNYL